MKRSVIAALAALALAAWIPMGGPAMATSRPSAKRCIPYPQCEGGYTPPVPGSLPETNGIIASLLDVKTQFVADVRNAAKRAELPMPNAPAGTVVDPYGAVCLPALATWAESLQPNAALPPDDSPDAKLVSAFEDTRIIAKVALNTAQTLTTSGLPFALNQACGGYLIDVAATGAQIIGGVAALNILLARWIPAPVLLKHGVGHLVPTRG